MISNKNKKNSNIKVDNLTHFFCVRFKYPCAFIILFFPLFSWSLSATTALTIQGRAPQILADGDLVPSDVNDAIAIKVNSSVFYGNSTLPANGFASTVTFNDFVPSFNNLILDDDGDGAASTPVTHSGFTIEWKDKYGKVISNYSDTLSSCYAPYQLKVSAGNVKVNTQYGDPSVNSLGNLSHTFPIYIDDYQHKICFIRPYYMNWFEASASGLLIKSGAGAGVKDPIYGGGYNSNQFDPLHGFLPNLSPSFPTTAFPEAKFSIVVPEPQTDYTFAFISGGNNIDPISPPSNSTPSYQIAGTTPSEIKFTHTKPSLSNTVKITHTPSGTSINYSFNILLWGKALGQMDYSTLLSSSCVSFTRQELSNSPQTSYSASDPNQNYNNAQTREIGTFTSEWGAMNEYSGSGIGWGYYWTNETYDSNNQHSINLANGSSFPFLKSNTGPIFCKE